MNKIKYFALTTVMFLTFAVSANAQTARPTPTPDPVLQACEETADKAKRLEIQVADLTSKLAIKDEQLALEKERVANKEEQVQFYKTAYEKMGKVDTNSAMVIENLRFQINDYKNENNDLRRENSSLRSSREWRTIFGTGLGFGAGYYLGNKK